MNVKKVTITVVSYDQGFQRTDTIDVDANPAHGVVFLGLYMDNEEKAQAVRALTGAKDEA